MSLVTLRNPDTGEQVAVEDPTPYIGWQQIAEGLPLDDQKADLWCRVKALRTEALALAPTSFGVVQADVQSRTNISGLVQMATIAKDKSRPFSETFTMADNSEVVMSADDMITFGVAVGEYVAAVHARGRELRQAIDAASSAAQLLAIDIDADWP